MGQQQLLLVILVTIIVGIATVVAINTFSSAADSANEDAIRQDLASIAASAQGYYMKPKMLGGGGSSFEGIDFTKLAFAGTLVGGDVLKAENANATYTITAAGAGATTFDISAVSKNATGVSLDAEVSQNGIDITTAAAAGAGS